MNVESKDAEYVEIILDCLRVSAAYQPKFGRGGREGLTLRQFRDVYSADPFYGWFGLDNPLLYAAHKAAGGMTSVYRQIGVGCERVFRKVLADALGLSITDTMWSYDVPTSTGKARKLALDGRIPLAQVGDRVARQKIQDWMRRTSETVGVAPHMFRSLTGVVFEVRQGYKSKDSKRQNADIANAASAYVNSYLPCVAVLSNQIDEDILRRYQSARWVVVTGTVESGDPLTSTYDFMRNIVGYDLGAFFKRNAGILQAEVANVLQILLDSGRS